MLSGKEAVRWKNGKTICHFSELLLSPFEVAMVSPEKLQAGWLSARKNCIHFVFHSAPIVITTTGTLLQTATSVLFTQ